MNERKYKGINLVLIFGFILFAFICVISVASPQKLSEYKYEMLLLFLIILGSVVTTVSITLTKKGYQLFLGLLLFGYGILTYLIVRILPYTILQMWPIFGVITSFFLLFDGLFIYKRFKLGFAFPAIWLLFLSVFFALFSFDVIKVPLAQVMLIAGPVLTVAMVLFFILVFIAQKKNKKLILDEEPEAFEDERIIPQTLVDLE